jgi:hypothetical protein
MVTLKADNRRRVQLPGAKPGQVFAYVDEGNGRVTLILVKPVVEDRPTAKVRFIKEDGFTVGVSDRAVDETALKQALAEFP